MTEREKSNAMAANLELEKLKAENEALKETTEKEKSTLEAKAKVANLESERLKAEVKALKEKLPWSERVKYVRYVLEKINKLGFETEGSGSVIHDVGNNCYYHLGAKVTGGTSYLSVKKFEPESQAWTFIANPNNTDCPKIGLHYHTSNLFNKAIFVFGGSSTKDAKSPYSNELWRMDLKSKSWKKISIVSSERPKARRYHQAVVFKDELYVFGGWDENGKVIKDMWKIDLKEAEEKGIASWKEIPVKGHYPEKLIRWRNVHLTKDGNLWCWEEVDKVFYEFDFKTQTWTKVETIFNEGPFSNDTVYFFGIGYIFILWGFNYGLKFYVVDTENHKDGMPLKFTQCQQASTENESKQTPVSDINYIPTFLHSSSDTKVTFVGKTTNGASYDPVWNFYTLSLTLK